MSGIFRQKSLYREEAVPLITYNSQTQSKLYPHNMIL